MNPHEDECFLKLKFVRLDFVWFESRKNLAPLAKTLLSSFSFLPRLKVKYHLQKNHASERCFTSPSSKTFTEYSVQAWYWNFACVERHFWMWLQHTHTRHSRMWLQHTRHSRMWLQHTRHAGIWPQHIRHAGYKSTLVMSSPRVSGFQWRNERQPFYDVTNALM